MGNKKLLLLLMWSGIIHAQTFNFNCNNNIQGVTYHGEFNQTDFNGDGDVYDFRKRTIYNDGTPALVEVISAEEAAMTFESDYAAYPYHMGTTYTVANGDDGGTSYGGTDCNNAGNFIRTGLWTYSDSQFTQNGRQFIVVRNTSCPDTYTVASEEVRAAANAVWFKSVPKGGFDVWEHKLDDYSGQNTQTLVDKYELWQDVLDELGSTIASDIAHNKVQYIDVPGFGGYAHTVGFLGKSVNSNGFDGRAEDGLAILIHEFGHNLHENLFNRGLLHPELTIPWVHNKKTYPGNTSYFQTNPAEHFAEAFSEYVYRTTNFYESYWTTNIPPERVSSWVIPFFNDLLGLNRTITNPRLGTGKGQHQRPEFNCNMK